LSSPDTPSGPAAPGPATAAAAAAAVPIEQVKAQEEEQETEMDYTQKVKAIATSGIYEFEYVEGAKAGQKMRAERHKISNRMMLELEKDRANYSALLNRFSVDGRADKPLSLEDRIQAAEMLSALYTKLAKYYFHISKEDFELMDWDSSKPNLDAAANVSIRGRPNLVKA
jgi:hypothetical protein